MSEDYSVLIIDMARYDPLEEAVVRGFPAFEPAKEFARRRVRDSIEDLRQAHQSKEELRRPRHTFGEDATVLGGEQSYADSHELDFLITHAASPDECDWEAIKRAAKAG